MANPGIINSLVVLTLAMGGGILLGRIKLGKVSLGVAGVMFVGLTLGHLGYRIGDGVLDFLRDFGLILFVYGIGIQVGPSFFSSFRKEGLKLNALAVSTVILSGVVAIILFSLTGTRIEDIVGIMSGSVTNTPGLGAAKSTLDQVKSYFPDATFNDPAIGYAITYPLGVAGIISMIILSKILLKIDSDKEMKSHRMRTLHREEPLIHKKCRVMKPWAFGKSLKQAIADSGKDIVISRLKHSGTQAVHSPAPTIVIEERDVLMVVGTSEDVDSFINLVGRESTDMFIESASYTLTKTLFVTKKSAANKTLSELDLFNLYDLNVTRVYRSGKEMLARPSLELFYGDRVVVVGTEENILEAEKIIGNSQKALLEPDFLSLFVGLLAGIIVGSIPFFIPGMPVPLKLGIAAGPLIVALVISRFGRISFVQSYFNTGAVYFMKDLGICMFFAAVGVHAGENFWDNFVQYNGLLWMSYGLLITAIPLIYMVIVGRFIFKFNFFQLTGLMSGTYTDPAALAFSTSYMNSDIPIQSYATVYPLVTIFRILVAQLLIIIFFN